MSQAIKTYFNWSSGKDAALALYYLQQEGTLNVDLLLTSVNGHHDRVTMHGLRRTLLEQQARAVGMPLQVIELPQEPSMEAYNQLMGQTVAALKSEGYTHCAFGDIFLEDLRAYREDQLKPHGINCHFPLWQKDTKALLAEFLLLGFKAIVICIKSELLDESFAGRIIDEQFINDLPGNVDPCGENGEFHTFCFDGPIFNKPVEFEVGEKIYRSYKNPDTNASQDLGFWFCDLLPK